MFKNIKISMKESMLQIGSSEAKSLEELIDLLFNIRAVMCQFQFEDVRILTLWGRISFNVNFIDKVKQTVLL